MLRPIKRLLGTKTGRNLEAEELYNVLTNQDTFRDKKSGNFKRGMVNNIMNNFEN